MNTLLVIVCIVIELIVILVNIFFLNFLYPLEYEDFNNLFIITYTTLFGIFIYGLILGKDDEK